MYVEFFKFHEEVATILPNAGGQYPYLVNIEADWCKT